MRFTTLIPIAFVLGCGSTIPEIVAPPTVDRAAQQAQAQQLAAAREAAARASVVADKIDKLQGQVARTESEARSAALAARRGTQVRTEVVERIVPVADPTFSAEQRDSLLDRATAASDKMNNALGRLATLQKQLQAMSAEMSQLQAFVKSPAGFVDQHGASGVIGLLMAIAAFFTGRKTRKLI